MNFMNICVQQYFYQASYIFLFYLMMNILCKQSVSDNYIRCINYLNTTACYGTELIMAVQQYGYLN